MKCLMLFAPHGTLSPLSDLFAAPGSIFKGQMFPPKHKIGWELFAQKNSAVVSHGRGPLQRMRYHEIPSFIKTCNPSTNRHVWKLNSLYLTKPKIILLILESLANLLYSTKQESKWCNSNLPRSFFLLGFS